ncbi:cytochrome P450 3A31 [Seiridium cupressi]
MIKTRSAQDTDAKQDLYSILAPALDIGTEGIRQNELWAEANLFLLAAGGTTKTALSATFFYLSRNPGAYYKLAREIRSAFQSASDINGQTLGGCHYLRACIDEALRLSPPGPDTIVGVNIYAIHQNPEYFEDPFEFIPERWIDDTMSGERRKTMRDAFIPFLVGSRGCAGKSMAYLEISLVIAKTLWYFDFGPASGELGQVGAGRVGLGYGRERAGEFQPYDHFTASHDGPYLNFEHRDTCQEPSAKYSARN